MISGIRIKDPIDLRYFQTRELLLESIMSRAFTFTFQNIKEFIISPIGIINPFDNSINCQGVAKWDTGSNVTLITKQLADKLNLIPEIHKRKAGLIEGDVFINVYIVSLELPNNIFVPNIEVLEWPNSTKQDIDVIIGMNIISHGDFTISNFEGKTKFGFRYPSFEHIELETDKKAIKD